MNTAWTVILIAGAGTFALRSSFLVVADRLVDLSPAIRRLLRQIPAAVLAALVVPALLRPEGTLDLASPELAAGALAAVVSWRTRNIALTLLVGLAALVAIRQLL